MSPSSSYITPSGRELFLTPISLEACPYIAELEKQCFSQPWSLSSFVEMTGLGYVTTVMATDSCGAVYGYALASLVIDTGEILNIAADPCMRKQGIGRAMIGYLHEKLKENGAAECFLEVREHNAPAIMLYEKMGYYPISVRKNYYKNPKENAIIMHKIF